MWTLQLVIFLTGLPALAAVEAARCGASDSLSSYPAPLRCLDHDGQQRCWYEYQATTTTTSPSPAGIKQYKYAGGEITIPADSDVALHGFGIWIITIAEGCTSTDVAKMADHMPAGSRATYSGHPSEGGLCVFMMEGTEDHVWQELATHTWPSPPSVVANSPVSAIPEQDDVGGDTAASWGLDRIDDPQGLDNSYSPKGEYPNEGAGTHVYVVDTGVHTSHPDFGGRAFSAFTMYPEYKRCDPADTTCGEDGHGHGTHCAGTIGGTTYGVAKRANIHGVKVLDDSASGNWGNVIMGIEFVIVWGNRPSVISMSLGGYGNYNPMKVTVDAAIASGIPVIVAAGNMGKSEHPDACSYTPAFIPNAITVGATARPSGLTDTRAKYSSYGTCLDLFAPGTNIVSTHNKDARSRTQSGTSMAAPHVSGVAALMLGEVPTMLPAEIINKLRADGTKDNIIDAKTGSPNIMLQIGLGPKTTTTTTTATATVSGDGVVAGPTRTVTTTVTTTTTGMPLIIDLHGYGSCGDVQAATSGWKQIADQHGATVLWPMGLPDASGSPVWGALGSAADSTFNPVDDVGFLRQMASRVLTEQAGVLDPERLYVVGYSQGAMMAQRFALEASDLVAAVGTQSGTLLAPPKKKLSGFKPVPIMKVHGTDDAFMPFDMTNVATWALLNGCERTATTRGDSFGIVHEYPNCQASARVVLNQIPGGEHDSLRYPFQTAPLLWDFVKDFRRALPARRLAGPLLI